jgi:hypothetical protein
MDAVTNPWLAGAETQQRCECCDALLCDGKCLDCASPGPAPGPSPFFFGLVDEPDADDMYSGPRGGAPVFDFEAVIAQERGQAMEVDLPMRALVPDDGGSAQRPIVPQAMRVGTPWMSTPAVN